MNERSVLSTANLPRQSRTDGFKVAFLHPEAVGGGFDPFLQIDAFALATPVFKPHPHAGFSAVTYILPESPGGFINRDSLGGRLRIGPGSLHWTAAGSGLLHEEVPDHLGIAAVGLQMFIDLPMMLKEAPPQWLHLEEKEVPRVRTEGAEIRAVVGESNGIVSPVRSPTPGVRLIDVTLQPGGRFEQALQRGENANLYVLQGGAKSGRDRQQLVAFDLAATDPDGTSLIVHAGPDGARFVLFGGIPLRQPIVAQGPFVMSDQEQMRRAMRNYASGQMGRLDPNHYGADGQPVL